MATYKVIQDIEAEDTLLGPLTLRQFVYAAIVAVSLFLCFKLVFSSVWWLTFLFIPHMILFAMLAAPFGHDQPSEVWLLAKIRFYLKPRLRIWDQSGMKQLVTITAPKKIERQLTDNLSQSEVRSRLKALANTIDSRGWVVKNVNVNLYTAPAYAQQLPFGSDRLIDTNALPHEVPSYDTQAISDMFDEQTNPAAQNLTQLMDASARAHRQEVINKMQPNYTSPSNSQGVSAMNSVQPGLQPDYWFMNGTAGQAPTVQPGYATFDHNPVVGPGFSTTLPAVAGADDYIPNEQAILAQLKAEQARPNPMNSHLKVIQPLSAQQQAANQQIAAQMPEPTLPEPVTPQTDPVILELASNDDLNVATLAREANKARPVGSSEDEIVVSLH